MKKRSNEQSPSYVLELSLDVKKFQQDRLDHYFECGRQIYHACLRELNRRFHHMMQSKAYQHIMKAIRATYQQESKIKHLNRQLGRKHEISLDAVRKPWWKKKQELHRQYGLDEYAVHRFVAPMCGRKGHFKTIPSDVGQKIASHAWQSMENILSGKGKKMHFKKWGQMDTLEGKSNKSGIKYRDGVIQWNHLQLPVILRKRDEYAHLALSQSRVKYCRIKRKTIRGKVRYFVQLVLEGFPPHKIDKQTGGWKHAIGIGKVGLDIGTQTLAICSEQQVKLVVLAPHVQRMEREKRQIVRKLDRQRRANNPNKYAEDGTVKKGNPEKWVRSQNYLKSLLILKEITRKQAVIRKQDHECLAHDILRLGDEIKVETMYFKALQKRAKETKKNEKTGKMQRKKRFGKSIAHRAPSLLLNILRRKLSYHGKNLQEIATPKVKASQYLHIPDEYVKKDLNERWNTMTWKNETFRIQRDLYSAFLIMNVTPTLDGIDRDGCFQHFDRFRVHHDQEICRIKEMSQEKLSSMGIR